MKGTHFSVLTLAHDLAAPGWRNSGAPAGLCCPLPAPPSAPEALLQPRPPGSPSGPPKPSACVPAYVPLFAGAWLPPTQANHCHHLPPHSVIARIKELSLKTTLNCVNERVRRGEVGKSKIMAYGDKVPLLGARRKVASLNSQHPLIQQRPFCNYRGFSPPPPADTQTERRDISMAPKSHGNCFGLNKSG